MHRNVVTLITCYTKTHIDQRGPIKPIVVNLRIQKKMNGDKNIFILLVLN